MIYRAEININGAITLNKEQIDKYYEAIQSGEEIKLNLKCIITQMSKECNPDNPINEAIISMVIKELN